METKKIKEYLINNNLFRKPKINTLGKGNIHNAWLIKEGKEKYCLLANNNILIKDNGLERQYLNLKFLEDEKINFCSKPIFFDKKNKILIYTYIPGNTLNNKTINKTTINNIATNIYKIHNIPYKNYKKFTKKNNIKPLLPQTPIENLHQYGINRFKYIKKYNYDKNLTKWIESQLQETKKYVKELGYFKKNIIFDHADITKNNVIKNKQGIFFIDWEQAKYLYNIDYGLTYIYIHGGFNDREFMQLIELYASLEKLSPSILYNKVKELEKINKIKDIVWAAMVYTEVKFKKLKKDEYYKKIIDKRIREFKKLI